MPPALSDETAPLEKLNAFGSFDEFKEFISPMFELSERDIRGLFSVLVKLESVGRNPIETVFSCNFQLGKKECLEMLKFMIRVDEMDLEELNAINENH